MSVLNRRCVSMKTPQDYDKVFGHLATERVIHIEKGSCVRAVFMAALKQDRLTSLKSHLLFHLHQVGSIDSSLEHFFPSLPLITPPFLSLITPLSLPLITPPSLNHNSIFSQS